jgi:hypothetical protein
VKAIPQVLCHLLHTAASTRRPALRFAASGVDVRRQGPPESGRAGDLGLRLARNGRHGTPNLPDQPLQFLTALLEHPGELVTRDELRHACGRTRRSSISSMA